MFTKEKYHHMAKHEADVENKHIMLPVAAPGFDLREGVDFVNEGGG